MRCLTCDYTISHLPHFRCPECNRPFDPHNPGTFAPDVPSGERSIAVGASLAGALLGWTFAFTIHILRQVHFSGFQRITDGRFWLFWTLITIAIWWAISVAPVLFIPKVRTKLRQPLWALLFGALHGMIGYTLLIGWWAGMWWYTLAFAGFVGAVTGLVTGVILRSERVRSASPPRRLGTCCALSPIAFSVIWLLLIWPLIGWIAPSIHYTYGDFATREKAARRAISRLRIGDSYENISYLNPIRNSAGNAGSFRIFGGPIGNGSAERQGYGVEVKDGVIVSITVNGRTQR